MVRVGYQGELSRVSSGPGVREGKGSYRYGPLADGKPNTFYSYEGEWKGGVKDGSGKFELRDLSIYEGEFMNGEMTGKGVRTYRDGSVYTGNWENGERRGYGVETKVVKDEEFNVLGREEYEGYWEGNKREGKGKLVLMNGDLQEGVFVRHRLHGPNGQLVVQERDGIPGSIYNGDFNRGKREGRGQIHVNDNRGTYDGMMANDLKNGIGRYECTMSGISYDGDWVDDSVKSQPEYLDATFEVAAQEAEKGKKGAGGGGSGEGNTTINKPVSVLSASAGGDLPTVNVLLAVGVEERAVVDCESGRTVELSLRNVDAELRDAHIARMERGDEGDEGDGAEGKEEKEEKEEGQSEAFPEWIGTERIPFFRRLPTSSAVSQVLNKHDARFPVDSNSNLVAFFETNLDSVSGEAMTLVATEVAELMGNPCLNIIGEGGALATSTHLGENFGKGSFTVALDFNLQREECGAALGGESRGDAEDDNEEKAVEEEKSAVDWNQKIIESEFLNVSIVNKNSFKVSFAEREWVLPPCEELNEGGSEWHSLIVSKVGPDGGIPTVIIDGNIVSGKANIGDAEDDAGIANSTVGEVAVEVGSAEEEKKSGLDEEEAAAIGIGGEGVTLNVRNCFAKNLGIWNGTCGGVNRVLGGTKVYKELRAATASTTAGNQKLATLNEERASINEGKEEADFVEVEEPTEIRDGCDPVDAISLKSLRGRVNFSGIVLSEKIAAAGAEYALVVEETSFGRDGTTTFAGCPFKKVKPSFLVFNL